MSPLNRRPPLVAIFLLRLFLSDDDFIEKSGDLEETYTFLSRKSTGSRAAGWFWLQVLNALPGFIRNTLFWRTIMIRNSIKMTFRNLKKNKGYSAINIIGLTVGLACFLLIFLWVKNELSYDRFHENLDRIYRLTNILEVGRQFPSPTYALAPEMKNLYPEVERMARVYPWHGSLVQYNDKRFQEERFFLT
ncbi:MAG: ABC transporter permease, partial [Desulfobulbaceae bacterium]|nr:ABC transporter permease [Desulfobulbaceae bacterium]